MIFYATLTELLYTNVDNLTELWYNSVEMNTYVYKYNFGGNSMKRLKNAGDLLQTVATVLTLLGTIIIVALNVICLSKFDEYGYARFNDTDGRIIVQEIEDSRELKTVLNYFTDEQTSAETHLRAQIILLMIVSLFKFWFVMLLLYAFGELCENVYDLNHSSRVTFYNEFERYKSGDKTDPKLERALTHNPALDSQEVWQCQSCGRINIHSSQKCVDCGRAR